MRHSLVPFVYRLNHSTVVLVRRSRQPVKTNRTDSLHTVNRLFFFDIQSRFKRTLRNGVRLVPVAAGRRFLRGKSNHPSTRSPFCIHPLSVHPFRARRFVPPFSERFRVMPRRDKPLLLSNNDAKPAAKRPTG